MVPQLRTERQKRWRNFASRYGESLVGFTVGLTISGAVALCMIMFVFSMQKEPLDSHASRVALLHTVLDNEELSSSQRQQLADGIIAIYQRGGTTDITADLDDSSIISQNLEAVQQVADTGNPLQLSVPQLTWGYFWGTWAWRLLLVYLTLLPAGWCLVYGYIAVDNEHYLMDWNWKRIWPIVLVALTFFPIGWLMYIPSFIRVAAHKRKISQIEAARQTAIAQLATLAGDRDAYWTQRDQVEQFNLELGLPYGRGIPAYEQANAPVFTPVADAAVPRNEFGARVTNDWDVEEDDTSSAVTERQATRPRFYGAPRAALRCYTDIRARAGAIDLNRRLEDAQADLSDTESSLRDYGNKVKNLQRERRELNATIANLRGLIENTTTNQADPAKIAAEFDSLLKLKGVKAVRVINDQLSLLLEARTVYKGDTYDLGDWELRFGVGTGLWTNELRSGVRDDWGDSYPVYRLGGRKFCFGDRVGVIEENMQKGQFLEAIEVAIDSMCSVNKEHRHYIPDAFYQINKDK